MIKLGFSIIRESIVIFPALSPAAPLSPFSPDIPHGIELLLLKYLPFVAYLEECSLTYLPEVFKVNLFFTVILSAFKTTFLPKFSKTGISMIIFSVAIS